MKTTMLRNRTIEEEYFDKYDKPYQREKLELTPFERQLARDRKCPEYIERNHHVTEAEDLMRHGYDPFVYEILKDGKAIIRSDLNCWDDDLSYWNKPLIVGYNIEVQHEPR